MSYVSYNYGSVEESLNQIVNYDKDARVVYIKDHDGDTGVEFSLTEATELVHHILDVVESIEDAIEVYNEEKTKESAKQQEHKELKELEARVDDIKATGYFVTANEANVYLTETEQAVLKMLVEKASRMSK